MLHATRETGAPAGGADRPTAACPTEVGTPTLTVAVVAGTRLRQDRLRGMLEEQGVEVVGVVRRPADALDLVRRTCPRAVLLDLAPDSGGLDVVEGVMARCPTPIVLTGSGSVDPAAAMARGALDVVPVGAEVNGREEYAAALVRHLRFASRVKVITHPRGRLARPSGVARPIPRPVPPRRTARPVVVAIGASTGGPAALARVLGEFPGDLPAAILVVQHMADGFVDGLASWLDASCPVPVSVAVEGQRLEPGRVLVAPSEANLELDSSLRVRLTAPRPGQLHLPEVDATFRSVAAVCGPRAIGVLLTGMGRDGAAGLLAMRAGGGHTIGQDEATSAVWGMPGAAAALDAVSAELPLPEIAAAVRAGVDRLVEAVSG